MLRCLQQAVAHADVGAVQAIEDVVIDEGTFKYVLMILADRGSGATKLILRGHSGYGYHVRLLFFSSLTAFVDNLCCKFRPLIAWMPKLTQQAGHL